MPRGREKSNFVGDERSCSSCENRIIVSQNMVDRRYYRCTTCLRAGYARQRLRNIEKSRERIRNHYYANKPLYNQWSSEYRRRNPEKAKARELLRTAIRSGRIFKQPCCVCGKPAQAHHDDYSKPLDVTWYCKKHHEDKHHLKVGPTDADALRAALMKINEKETA